MTPQPTNVHMSLEQATSQTLKYKNQWMKDIYGYDRKLIEILFHIPLKRYRAD